MNASLSKSIQNVVIRLLATIVLLFVLPSLAFAVRICNSPHIDIPNGASRAINGIFVPDDSGILADLNVELYIAQSPVADLRVTLEHVDTGTVVTLLDHPGHPAEPMGCRGSNVSVTLDDDASVWAENTCNDTAPALDGSLSPAQSGNRFPLSAFHGEYASGNWVLNVYDTDVTGSAGTLQAWCINFPTIDGDYCVSGTAEIPDNDPTGEQMWLHLPHAEGVIGDLNVAMLIDHEWVGDISVILENVTTGTSVTLIDRPGRVGDTGFGCAGNDINVILDDNFYTPVQDQCEDSAPTIYGTFAPNSPLSAFNGQDLAGHWFLRVIDHANFFSGAIHKWCMSPRLLADLDVTTTITQNPITDTDSHIFYNITLTNHGPSVAHDVRVSDQYPWGFDYFGGSSSHGSFDFNEHEVWDEIGDLAVGESAEFSLAFDVNTPPQELPVLTISSPPELAGELPIYRGGMILSWDGHPGVSGNIVFGNDGSTAEEGTVHDGCQDFTNAAAINGNIVVIDTEEGECTRWSRYNRALDAGAAAVIRVLDVDQPACLGMGAEHLPDIPIITLRKTEADALISALNAGAVSGSLAYGTPKSVFLAHNSFYVMSDAVDPDSSSYYVDDCDITDALVRVDDDPLTPSGLCLPGFGDCLHEGLAPTACTVANGFLGQIDIASVVNLQSTPLAIKVRYIDLAGVLRGEIATVLDGNLKRDFIINDLGLAPDTIGSVCIETDAATRGAWSGGVTIYKPDTRYGEQAFGEAFDFALYYPFTNATTGTTTVPLNTFHLGTDPAAVVANWVSIADAVRGDGRGLEGRIAYIDEAGLRVTEVDVSVPDGGRMDYAGHEGLSEGVITDAVGMAQFIPDDADAQYYLTLTRYFYDCPGASCTNFLTAFNIPQRPGINTAVFGGVSTMKDEISVIELNNISSREVTADISIRDTAGYSQGSPSVAVPGLGTRHVIVNQAGDTGYLANGNTGSAQVRASSGFMSALSLRYKLSSTGQLLYAYAAPLMSSPGEVQVSEFNTFILHENDTELHNTTGEAIETRLDVIDVGGANLLNEVFDIPAYGSRRFNGLALPANTYGTINIQAPVPGLVVRNYVSREDEYTLSFGGK